MASGCSLPDLFDPSVPLLEDIRMDKAVEQIQFLPIGKDDVAELAAVDGAVRLEDLISEMADDLPSTQAHPVPQRHD